jgi:hypothetical protein
VPSRGDRGPSSYSHARLRPRGDVGFLAGASLGTRWRSLWAAPQPAVNLMTPGYFVEVCRDVLDQEDGPMLIHSLQGCHRHSLRLPRRDATRHLPSKDLGACA